MGRRDMVHCGGLRKQTSGWCLMGAYEQLQKNGQDRGRREKNHRHDSEVVMKKMRRESAQLEGSSLTPAGANAGRRVGDTREDASADPAYAGEGVHISWRGDEDD